MLIINPDFFNIRISNFIEDSINIILANENKNKPLQVEKEYWLFYYIKDNFKANLQYLNSIVDIDSDVFGFVPIWRNIRNSIEAFYDLYNLKNDSTYYDVLWYCHNNDKFYRGNEKYKSYIFKNRFTIISKNNIACNLYSFNSGYGKDLIDTVKRSNKYIHPDVFVDTIKNREEKKYILKMLISKDIYMLDSAYKMILEKYYESNQPRLFCMQCRLIEPNCKSCYTSCYNKILEYLEGNIFIEKEVLNSSYY